MSTPASRLQPGIFFAAGQRPPPCWRLVLLDLAPGTTPGEAHDALARLMEMLGDLRGGQMRELARQPPEHACASAEQFAGLEVLLGVGRRLFDSERHAPPLTSAPRPEFLSWLPMGAPLAGLPWGSDDPSGEADVALQLTAEHQAGVHCAAVEVWAFIADERLPLTVTTTFSGFGRQDGRGWLGFHDGVSNLETGQRLTAITAAPDPAWMAGGTYLAFLRLGIDLASWRSLDRARQELLVGRDKLSGTALIATTRDAEGNIRPVAGPGPSAQGRADWIDPPQTTDPLLEASHIHRANQNRSSASAPGGWRMFRQGYDFLDAIGPGGPVVGLNFVSFQRDLSVLRQVLHLPGWLGEVNFGGPATPKPGEPVDPGFLSLRAGGFYAVPPRGDPFPGATLFTT